jgi:hypothetical protein
MHAEGIIVNNAQCARTSRRAPSKYVWCMLISDTCVHTVLPDHDCRQTEVRSTMRLTMTLTRSTTAAHKPADVPRKRVYCNVPLIPVVMCGVCIMFELSWSAWHMQHFIDQSWDVPWKSARLGVHHKAYVFQLVTCSITTYLLDL